MKKAMDRNGNDNKVGLAIVIINNIGKNKDKNHMIISIDSKKAFEQIQHLLIIKIAIILHSSSSCMTKLEHLVMFGDNSHTS